MTDRDKDRSDGPPPAEIDRFFLSDCTLGARDREALAADMMEIRRLLALSDVGRALLTEATFENVDLRFDEQMNGYGVFSPSHNLILLNPAHDIGDLVGAAAHELRHFWQDFKGFGNEQYRSPRDLALIGRLKEADAETVAIHVASEIRRAGDSRPWDAMRKSGISSDMMQAYASAAPECFTDEVLRRTFDQWFADSRRRGNYDREFVAFVEERQHQFIGWARSGGFIALERDEDRMVELSALPGGTNYLSGNDLKLTDAYYRGGMAPELETRLAYIADRVDRAFDAEMLKKKQAEIAAKLPAGAPRAQPKPGTP